MQRNKIILVLLISMCIILFQSGCANTRGAGGKTGDAGGEQPTALEDVPGQGVFDPMAKYEPGITLTIPGATIGADNDFPEGMNDENNPWREAYRDELGITLEYKWTVDGSKYNEKLDTQIAAGDIPDILHSLGRAQFDQLTRLGLATPMEALLEKYGTDLTKKVLNSDGGYSILYSTGNDGRLYALPHTYGYTDNVCAMWIRTDWLRRLNLKAPATMDELYGLVKAFVEQDPDGNGEDDTLGLVTSNELWQVGSIFNAFGSQPFWSWYKDTDGKLRYSTCYLPENIKKALAYLSKLYTEGYMDQEFGAVNYNKYLELLVSGRAGIAFEPAWFVSRHLYPNIEKDPEADWDAYPIPSGLEDGKPARPFAYYGPAAYNVVSAKCKNPEAAVKMLNLYCEKVYGPFADKGYEKYIMDRNGYNMKGFTIIAADWANRLDMYENVAKAVEERNPSKLTYEEKQYYTACLEYLNGDGSQWAEYKTYGPGNATIAVVKHYINNAPPLFNSFYGPEFESEMQYKSDLNAKWLSVCVEIIMGSKPVSSYDDFVRDWYSLGGDKMEKDVNDWAGAHPETVK